MSKARKISPYYNARSRQPRRVSIKAFITRSHDPGPFAFSACVRVAGGSMKSSVEKRTSICANGRNPRKALANALAKYAGQLRRRGGAFRGLGRR